MKFNFKKNTSAALHSLNALFNSFLQGNFDVVIEKELLDRNDGVGNIARSLQTLLKSLGEQKNEHERIKGQLQEKLAFITDQEKTTNDYKKAMINLIEDARESADLADRERNMYFLLLASIGEGVYVLDAERKLTLMNKSAEETLGYAASEVIGKKFDTVLHFIHQDKKPLEEEFWNSAFTDRQPKVLPPDISVIGKDGKPVPIADVVAPVIDTKTQELKGLIVTFRDVRDERALEEARIGFISIASHQLRTPLTSMRWFAEMLMGGDAGEITDEQKHFVERIYQGTDRMISLVNFLLQIARVEAGRVKIEPLPIDLRTTTQGVVLTLKTLLDGKKQQVVIAVDPDPFPTIPLDQEVIWQVIQNLLSNANRYSPENATISVFIKKKGDLIEYSVKDQGIGIPKDQQGRLFEKFFRAENALKMVPEGSGLGLSLVKLLVEGWGGKIWFETEEGKGTTFFFTIPVSGMKAKEGEVKLSV